MAVTVKGAGGKKIQYTKKCAVMWPSESRTGRRDSLFQSEADYNDAAGES